MSKNGMDNGKISWEGPNQECWVRVGNGTKWPTAERAAGQAKNRRPKGGQGKTTKEIESGEKGGSSREVDDPRRVGHNEEGKKVSIRTHPSFFYMGLGQRAGRTMDQWAGDGPTGGRWYGGRMAKSGGVRRSVPGGANWENNRRHIFDQRSH
ncbi:hypothetical protein niasHT_018645 [Heterodera trifolii]|uniref:Uncharacterized protein n=1 Tax=Heterodera trifolii TaxID=157864 RepID=A0ABD2KZZ8_9BILA